MSRNYLEEDRFLENDLKLEGVPVTIGVRTDSSVRISFYQVNPTHARHCWLVWCPKLSAWGAIFLALPMLDGIPPHLEALFLQADEGGPILPGEQLKTVPLLATILKREEPISGAIRLKDEVPPFIETVENMTPFVEEYVMTPFVEEYVKFCNAGKKLKSESKQRKSFHAQVRRKWKSAEVQDVFLHDVGRSPWFDKKARDKSRYWLFSITIGNHQQLLVVPALSADGLNFENWSAFRPQSAGNVRLPTNLKTIKPITVASFEGDDTSFAIVGAGELVFK